MLFHPNSMKLPTATHNAAAKRRSVNALTALNYTGYAAMALSMALFAFAGLRGVPA